MSVPGGLIDPDEMTNGLIGHLLREDTDAVFVWMTEHVTTAPRVAQTITTMAACIATLVASIPGFALAPDEVWAFSGPTSNTDSENMAARLITMSLNGENDDMAVTIRAVLGYDGAEGWPQHAVERLMADLMVAFLQVARYAADAED